MKKLTPLFNAWKGMAPDNPRDAMSDAQVWKMEDYIPRILGSSLESRQGWTYHVSSPLGGGYIIAQQWVNTLGGSHHLALTPGGIYNLDNPASPRLVLATTFPGLWPMATMYEYVLIPRPGDVLPIVLRYEGPTEVVVTTDPSTPKAKIATVWQSRFVLANGSAAGVNQPNFVYFLPQTWGAGLTATPVWDPKAYVETSADVTGLAATRNSLIIFHEGNVERLRGTKAPGAGVADDVWMEPLIGLGGCNEPHTICYWNDNVVFADARGVYLTDGTTIKDITAQGGIGREWRRAYDPLWRVSAGVIYDQYVVAMVDITNGLFKKCFVGDLYSRNWSVFNNMPFSCFVSSSGEIERLFGGGLDGRIANVSECWREADATTDTQDANGLAVLPQLETAWYRMTDDESMKRVKNVYFSYDLSEDTGELKVYASEKVNPTPGDWILLKTLGDRLAPAVNSYERRRLPLGRESWGFTFKIETTGKIKNLKLYDLAAEALPSREASYA